MARILFFTILLFTCFACEHSSNEDKNANRQRDSVPEVKKVTPHNIVENEKPSPHLANFEQSKCVHDSSATEDYYTNPKYLTIDKQLIRDTLIIFAKRIANCKTKYIGSIEILNDTLFLYYQVKKATRKNKNGTIDTIFTVPIPCDCMYCFTFYVANVTSMPKHIKAKETW